MILEEIEVISLSDLIHARLDKFEDISEFMLAIDVLYVLGKIELEEGEGVIRYVN
nr:ABC-three component system middle component 7 [Salinivibrio sp. AR647]